MIRHTVVFSLHHPPGSKEEHDFLEAGRKLASIKTVQNFECLRQISPKNDFSFGFSMEFGSPEDYEFYNQHPDHQAFVHDRWIPGVTNFMEIDYMPCEVQSRNRGS